MSCNKLSEEMIVGEKRWLEYKVSPCGTAPQYFNILSATYEIEKLYNEDTPIIGDCIVDNEEKTIKCLVDAKEKGGFMMTLSWSIAEEMFKERVRIDIC